MSLPVPPFLPPVAASRVKMVNSFRELVTTPFSGSVNALCWQRTLQGDFNEVVEHLTSSEGDMATLDKATLRKLTLTAGGRVAVKTLLDDLQCLEEWGLSPVLDCIHRYPRDEEGGPVPTDVYSLHVDSATVETDTYLCSYTESASEGLPNEEVQRFVDIPEIRAELLTAFGGKDGGEFLDYLKENCYDLHYAPLPHARPFSFGLGNLWRIAVEYPGSPVLPCIHRAPATVPGRPPRLLLIS